MPKAYLVVSYHSISDPQKLAAYAALAPAATAPFGARYIARGTAVAAFEAGLKERIRDYRVSQCPTGPCRLRESRLPCGVESARRRRGA
jgi:hypothetical protein